MSDELNIKQELETRFKYLADKVVVKGERRIFVDVPLEKFGEVLDYAVEKLKFDALKMITGLDEVTSFGVIYHLDKGGKTLLNLKVHTSHDDPKVKTVSDRFPGVDPYEREIVDLFGIKVEGLSAGRRYPLPENWPDGQYPLRKDWKNELSDDVGDMGEGDQHA